MREKISETGGILPEANGAAQEKTTGMITLALTISTGVRQGTPEFRAGIPGTP